MSKYVIIGNSIAAVGTVEGIRSIDKDGSITIISGENHHVYGRPLISYYLQGRTCPEKMLYRPADFYEKNGCDVVYGRCTSIDSIKKTVVLEDGTELGYEKLCVATGSTPFVPPFEGLDTVADKHSFMTLDDAEALKASLTEKKKVLIVGAGLIGLKCAEGISALAESITICDLADRVMPSVLDAECADIVKNHLEKSGFEFMLSDTAVKFDTNKAYMKSGKVVEFDVLVLAVGVRPSTALVKEAGGEVARGIVLDNRMRTSLEQVYAAGDCTESFDITTDSVKIIATLPNAYMQGECAGKNMAGGDAVFDNSIPMNSIGFFGLHVVSAGAYIGDEYVEKTETGIKKLYTKDGLLKGYTIVGDVDRAGIYTSLIRNKTPLDTIDFELIKKSPSLLPFSAEERHKMTGGAH